MIRKHWEDVYTGRSPEALSWFEAEPALSLALIDAAGVRPADPVIDVGGGASVLVDYLLERGFTRVSVLDIADSALDAARRRLGPRQAEVTWQVADITQWQPTPGAYALWHDRAVFHFLVEERDRQAYLRALRQGLAPGGHAVFATFARDGPQSCSGLPVQRYSAASLHAVLGDGFELCESRQENHETPGGRSQAYQWCLFRRRPPATTP